MAAEQVVFKYVLPLRHASLVEMPLGADILSIQDQRGDLTLWALVNSNEQQTVVREFTVVGTGHLFKAHGHRHVASVQQGAYVWHVFERIAQ